MDNQLLNINTMILQFFCRQKKIGNINLSRELFEKIVTGFQPLKVKRICSSKLVANK